MFDPDLLRVLVAFADAGTLARASEIVGRSPSAVTAQIQRLEEVAGTALLAPSGRGRVLTPAGEELVSHARRILAAHRDAWLSVTGSDQDGQVAIGCTQDFALSALPALLRTYARTHPRVRIDVRIGRTNELTAAFASGTIDVALVVRSAPSAEDLRVWREPMVWLAASDGLAVSAEPLPIGLLDAPCGFRTAALAALDAARRPYRIAATSPSLAGLQAAVVSGLAVTPRTARLIGDEIGAASRQLKLPELPDIAFALRIAAGARRPVCDLADLLADGVAGAADAPRRYGHSALA